MREVKEKSRFQVPLFVWPAAVVAVLAVVGLIGPCRDEVEVLVPTHAVAPYAMLDVDDFEAKTEEEPGGDVLLAGAALGRSVALRELPKGELIGKGDVVTGLEEVPGPVRLELRPERASALGIEAGESVELRLSPTGRAGEPIVVTGVLLAIPDAEDGAEQTYVVAFTRPAAKRLMGSLGRAVLLLSAG